ncbi:Transcription termination factor MTEF1, chloroplastic [Sesamum angolense]|uniref:Transcription termination factor MTEF1, chloroplastic n=1 Tax=Sesamum angolense TaxID=2727404 RepID=A0AAE1WZI6_9LAMI|nr:Transcription termination factor MTEF1, chloroplastic [Sesamum angolense]
MLIDGVDDLDDWNSWARSSSQEITGDSLEFKKKVYQLAEQKGDNDSSKRGGLNLLGCEHTSFRHLIESFPRLLFLPLQSRVKPIVKFLENIGVPKGCVRNILLLYPPILSYDIEKGYQTKITVIGAKDNDLGKMLVKYPWILSPSILENFEKVLDFFDEEKVPKISSSRAIKAWPHILGCSVNKLKVMVERFGEIGITNKKLGHVIATSPQLLLRKPQEFVQVVIFFKGLGLDEEAISRTLGRCPEIFAASMDKTLEKKLEFLSNVGIPKSHLPRVIRKYPELFVCDVDRALLPRMRYLMRIGLSKKDIGLMPVRCVVDYPRYFSYSLEKKIKPRYWVLKGRNVEFSLKEMLGKNDEEFAAEYLGMEEMLVPPS